MIDDAGKTPGHDRLRTGRYPRIRLLVVDDHRSVLRSLAGVLGDEGYLVETAASAEEGLRLVDRTTYDAIFLDIWLPGMDGIDALKRIRARRPRQYVIMISGHGTIETAVQATKLGAYDFIEKPLARDKVLLVLSHALKQKRLETENRSLKDLVRQETVMIGTSVPMQALRQQIDFAAPTEGRVVIYGENGTGKELVARLLHLNSARREGPFVEVNCAAIPDDLIESELFGSVKGGFTGSTENRKGRFKLADGGTLFLDEVADMSLKTQARVLRVLENQRFYPVGSQRPTEVDTRVLAATNKDLEKQIETGLFREDLYFRLNVIPFEVPPLRERKEDIPQLLDYFMEVLSPHHGKPAKIIPPEVRDRLLRYHWPGNVRELRNIVERWIIMVPGGRVKLSDLPRSILDGAGASRPEARSWQEARSAFESDFLTRKLQQYGGNISRTAAEIGMERSHLHRKLKAYGISVGASRGKRGSRQEHSDAARGRKVNR